MINLTRKSQQLFRFHSPCHRATVSLPSTKGVLPIIAIVFDFMRGVELVKNLWLTLINHTLLVVISYKLVGFKNYALPWFTIINHLDHQGSLTIFSLVFVLDLGASTFFPSIWNRPTGQARGLEDVATHTQGFNKYTHTQATIEWFALHNVLINADKQQDG